MIIIADLAQQSGREQRKRSTAVYANAIINNNGNMRNKNVMIYSIIKYIKNHQGKWTSEKRREHGSYCLYIIHLQI